MYNMILNIKYKGITCVCAGVIEFYNVINTTTRWICVLYIYTEPPLPVLFDLMSRQSQEECILDFSLQLRIPFMHTYIDIILH